MNIFETHTRRSAARAGDPPLAPYPSFHLERCSTLKRCLSTTFWGVLRYSSSVYSLEPVAAESEYHISTESAAAGSGMWVWLWVRVWVSGYGFGCVGLGSGMWVWAFRKEHAYDWSGLHNVSCYNHRQSDCICGRTFFYHVYSCAHAHKLNFTRDTRRSPVAPRFGPVHLCRH
jgi:hypothetical protein